MSVIKKSVLLITVCAITAGMALAETSTLDLYLNNNAVRGSYVVPLTSKAADLDFGILHHKDDGDLGEVGFHINGLSGKGSATFDVALGGRLAYVDTPLGSGIGLGLGARVRYAVPSHEEIRLGLDLHYAPKSVSLGDSEGLLDMSFRAGYQVHERAEVYLLVSTVRAEFEHGSTTIDRGVHFGLTVSF